MNRRKRIYVRFLCFLMATFMLSSEVFAAFKEIGVGGAYSINDLGLSDNRITMDELKSDYSAFKRTDWLTEYFHKDKEAPHKVGLGEAASWLIDNGIINRDASVIVDEIHPAIADGVPYSQDGAKILPKITLEKANISQFYNKSVHRSDMIMYLYKAVFGSVDARTIAVETPNMRVDGYNDNFNGGVELHQQQVGQKKTLWKMMDDHKYWDTIKNHTAVIDQVAAPGIGQASAGFWYAESQGLGGAGNQTVPPHATLQNGWRYTPQGDEYESMFGDTNIFVSDVLIGQQANSGLGSVAGSSTESNIAGDTNNPSFTQPTTASTSASNSQNGLVNAGPSMGTGAINEAVSYETDYKQIYYIPGADIMFYRADDCVELYIQYALSKGLLRSDPIGKTKPFNDVFVKPMASTGTYTKLHPWSPDAPPFMINAGGVTVPRKDLTQVNLTSEAIYADMQMQNYEQPLNCVLGNNYNIKYESSGAGGNKLTITRQNLFASNTGYFDSESVSRMQFYEYIYNFVGGSEKKLSDMETEIVNYKYGLMLEPLGNEEEVRILKYLVAKGILDYTDSYDFQNLDANIVYSDFLTILYRVANPDARLDFSKIQLTDSETQWKDLGFQQKTTAITDASTTKFVGGSNPNYDEDDVIDPDPTQNPSPVSVLNYNQNGQLQPQLEQNNEIEQAAALLNEVVMQGEQPGVVRTGFFSGNANVGNNQNSPGNEDQETTGNTYGTFKLHDVSFDFMGCYVSEKQSTNGIAAYTPPAEEAGTLDLNTMQYDLSKFGVDNDKTINNDFNWDNVINYYIGKIVSNKYFMNYWGAQAEKYGAENVAGIRTFFTSAVNGWNRDGRDRDTDAVGLSQDFIRFKERFVKNIYVNAMIRNGDINKQGIVSDLQQRITEVETDQKARGFFQKIWDFFSGEERNKKAMLSLLYYVHDSIAEIGTADDPIKSISFTINERGNALAGQGLGYAKNCSSPVAFSNGNMFCAIRTAVQLLEEVKIECSENGQGGQSGNVTWKVIRESPYEDMKNYLGQFNTTASAEKLAEVGNAFKCKTICSSDDPNVNTTTATSRALGRTDYDTAAARGATLDVQAPSDGNTFGGFISWTSIAANKDILHIEQIGECILHNTVFDTYAYFPPDGTDYKYALVGNAIVDGDPNEGVAKNMDGQTWYWYDAIRLLVGVQDEGAILGGVDGISLPQQAIIKHAKNIPVASESGFEGHSLNVIRLMQGFRQYMPTDSANAADEDALKFTNTQDPVHLDCTQSDELDLSSVSGGMLPEEKQGVMFANYIAASTANRSINMVYRKLTSQVDDNPNATQVAFALLFLKPTAVGETAGVNQNMSLEETLDAISMPPSDESAKAKWVENKALCNDFLNWIYNTENQEYINTGYLLPEVHIYSESGNTGSLNMEDFGRSITERMKLARTGEHQMVFNHGLTRVNGFACDPGVWLKRYESMNKDSPEYIVGHPEGKQKPKSFVDEDFTATYYMGDDYRIAVVGDRVFVNEQAVPNLVGYLGYDKADNNSRAYRYKMVNKSVAPTKFYPGLVVNLETDEALSYIKGDVIRPKMTILSVGNGGAVKAQIGPLYGLPCTVEGQTVVLPPAWVKDHENDAINSLMQSSDYNLWSYVKDGMLSGMLANIEWSNKVVEYPKLNISPTGSRYGVYTGTSIRVYEDTNTQNKASEYNCGSIAVDGGTTFTQLTEQLSKGLANYNYPTGQLQYLETYAEVEFSAYNFTINDRGILTPVDSTTGLQAKDLFSPSAFTSVNDLIIESMIAQSRAAIPINQVPEGAILSIGDGWYIAANSDENNKKFAGYAFLDDAKTSERYAPTIQDAAVSMSSEMIRGGNQYINIVHYITDMTVLDDTPSGRETSYKTWVDKLKPLAQAKMKDNSSTTAARIACPAKSSMQYRIDTGEELGDFSITGYHYAPVLLQFAPILMAYPVSSDDQHPVYKICNYAPNSMSGALAQLPFFATDILSERLHDMTTTVISGGFTINEGANHLMDEFKAEFEKAFAGDLFTLARLIMFVILIWLFVMSWVCYGFYYSRLMPLVDAICHPVHNGQQRGIDLFKIFSFGTISVDSDFKLGRFLQYDFIIAILILVVWKSGNITF